MDAWNFGGYGEDVRISDNTVWRRPGRAYIGSHVAIDDFFYCTTEIHIGHYVHIAPFTSVIGGAEAVFIVNDFATIAAGSRIIVRGDAHMGEGLVSPVIPDEFRDEVIGRMITMQKFSALGTNVVMMPNTWLAEGVIVGANSLVTKPIEEPWTVWFGSPARKIKDRPREKMLEYAERLYERLLEK